MEEFFYFISFTNETFLHILYNSFSDCCNTSRAPSPSSPSQVIDVITWQDHPKDPKKRKEYPKIPRLVDSYEPWIGLTSFYVSLVGLCLTKVPTNPNVYSIYQNPNRPNPNPYL